MRAPTFTSGLVAAAFVSTGLIVLACGGDDANPSVAGGDGGTDALVAADGPSPDSGSCAAQCGGQCVDTKSDALNCGRCDHVCKSGTGKSFACVEGQCGNEVVRARAGGQNTCLLLGEGTVYCNGSQRSGLLGEIGNTPTAVFRKIADLDGVADIVLGDRTACALKKEGSVWCWGSNESGQTGRAGAANAACEAGACRTKPEQVILASKVTQLAATDRTFCALTESKDVYCWGANGARVLGIDAESSADPVKISVVSGDVQSLSIGSPAGGGVVVACVVRTDSSVWCWGSNHDGELGHNFDKGTPADVSCPGVSCNPVPQPVGAPRGGTLKDVVLTQNGEFASCALKKDGSVWCWGSSSYGLIGTGGTTSEFNYVPKQILVGQKQLVINNLNGFAVDGEGNATAWGALWSAALGSADAKGVHCAGPGGDGITCQPTPLPIPALKGVTQIDKVGSHGVALKADGSVLTWGYNGTLQLGHVPGSAAGDTACNGGTGNFCNPTPGAISFAP